MSLCYASTKRQVVGLNSDEYFNELNSSKKLLNQ